MTFPRKKLVKRFIIVLFLLVFSWFAYANWVIPSNAENKLFNRVSECPEAPVALVLGTSRHTKNGNENRYFNYRIDAAVKLFRAGKIKHILVSGDNSQKNYDEPTDMKNALIAAGIPSSKITLDYAGFRTLDSMERALKVFGQKKVIVVSQQFHNERAIYLGEHFGMTVYGFNALDVQKNYSFKTKLREKFARMKVFWDIAFGIDSKFLGKPVKIEL